MDPAPSTSQTTYYLECPNCGSDAVESDRDGMFYDGQSGACAECGSICQVSCDSETPAYINRWTCRHGTDDDTPCPSCDDEPTDWTDAIRELKTLREKNTGGLSPGDVGTVVVCAVRYALGRLTYMPSVVAGIAMRANLPASDRDSVIRDIREAEHRDRLGGRGDAREWRRLLSHLERVTP